MLLKLPLDLLIDIALYLPISDKLELVLTCKKLKDVILDRCFYETLDFDCENKEETEAIVFEFRKNRSNGQKVKVLKINLDHLSDQLFGEIPLIFPNVVEFRDYTLDSQARPEKYCSEFIKWKDTLEYLSDLESEKTGVVYKLLEKNVFSRLTDLRITPFKDEGSDLDLSDCIENAPALKSLLIEEYVINLEELETIHSSCPLLTNLQMIHCSFQVAEDERLPKKTIPALHMSRFSMKYTSLYDQQCLLLNYITRKYRKLVELELGPHSNEGLIYLLFRDQNYDEMLSNPDYIVKKNELQASFEAHNNSASGILSKLPNTLKLLKIMTPDLQNITAIFSKQCINITQLEFFEYPNRPGSVFRSSDDIANLKNIPFLKKLSIFIDPSIQEYEHVTTASTSATQLDVVVEGASPQNDMDIGWILSAFPSLNELNIQYSGTRLIGYENNPPKTYPNLTKLSIGPSATHLNLLKFISRAAPNIKDLHWFIFGEYIRKESERSNTDRPLIIQLDPPKIKKGIPRYRIDLTGFHLDCFHLKIDLREKSSDGKDTILLKLRDRFGIRKRLIISERYNYMGLAWYRCGNVEEKFKKKITILYDYTKTITINSKVSIDLQEGQITLKDHW